MWTRPEVVAHRGAAAYAPEHTFAAYDLALEQGADALELDLRAAGDGRLVVLHDPTLERTSGDPRAIADVRLADLPADRRPLELDEVLDRYGRATRLLLELKDPTRAMETALAGAVRRHALAGSVTVQSFDHRSLRRLRRIDPTLAVAPLLCETLRPHRVPVEIHRAAAYAAGVGVFHPSVDPAAVHAARASGIALRAYTVNEPGELARLAALGIDGVITDAPDVAARARAAAQPSAALAA